MKKLLWGLVCLAISSVAVQAKTLTKEQLPEKAITHFNKKHPKVTNLVITEQKHFGQALYELSFTEELTIKVPDDKGTKLKTQVSKEEVSIFYRTNGHFFVDAEKIYAFNIIPGVVMDGLKAAFPDYKITAAQLVINPNGVGEEYEVVINSLGNSWAVSLDSKGGIISKENMSASATPASTAPAAPAAAAKTEAAKPVVKETTPAVPAKK
jgi:hypothetical protein